MPSKYKPTEYKPLQKVLTNLYKPRAYIWDFTVYQWANTSLTWKLGSPASSFSLSCSYFSPLNQNKDVKGIGGGVQAKTLFLFILINVIALSFFFPKCGHTLFKSRYFKFHEHLQRGHISKYR